MNINSNGIRVVTPIKQQRRKPLDFALDTMTFWRKEAGQVVTIVGPRFSHLRQALKEDGWRVMR